MDLSPVDITLFISCIPLEIFLTSLNLFVILPLFKLDIFEATSNIGEPIFAVRPTLNPKLLFSTFTSFLVSFKCMLSAVNLRSSEYILALLVMSFLASINIFLDIKLLLAFSLETIFSLLFK